jgi:hypothetical protein
MFMHSFRICTLLQFSCSFIRKQTAFPAPFFSLILIFEMNAKMLNFIEMHTFVCHKPNLEQKVYVTCISLDTINVKYFSNQTLYNLKAIVACMSDYRLGLDLNTDLFDTHSSQQQQFTGLHSLQFTMVRIKS